MCLALFPGPLRGFTYFLGSRVVARVGGGKCGDLDGSGALGCVQYRDGGAGLGWGGRFPADPQLSRDFLLANHPELDRHIEGCPHQ